MTKMIVNTELTSLPLISTPSNWNRNERSHVSIQVLQEFEKDAYVLVCKIPGPVHLRYLYVLRQVSRTMSNGKRKMSCIMVITSTKTNERSRSADEPHHGVEWPQASTYPKMPGAPHPAFARARVLDSHRAGGDWMLVAAHNGIPATTARRIVEVGRVELLPRGGANFKCTPEIEAALEKYLE
ncbi:hypothetical protein PInf_009940 [Phytophthora infestans]|nr:hypothetical protein PInf_009940 [Phytophthora infestans]